MQVIVCDYYMQWAARIGPVYSFINVYLHTTEIQTPIQWRDIEDQRILKCH